MGYTYFHSRGCGKKFESPDELEVVGLCERCKRPFTEIHPYRCKVCGGEFRSDVFYPDGSLIVCPIHHGPVIVGKTSYLNWLITFLSALFAIGLAVVLIIFLVWIGSQLINLVLALLAEIVGAIAAVQHQLTSAFNALRDAAPLAVGFAVDVLKSLAKALLYLVAILLFVLVLMIRPTRDFDEIYSHSIRRNPEDLLRRQYGIAASQPSEVVLRETVKRSRKAVLSQRRIIGGLFIGISLLALKCFLPVNNLEDARQVARSTLQLGTMNVIMFTVTFYGGRRYFELDKK